MQKKIEKEDKTFTSDSYCCVSCCHFLSDNLKEKRSVPLFRQSGIAYLKNSLAHWLKITELD